MKPSKRDLLPDQVPRRHPRRPTPFGTGDVPVKDAYLHRMREDDVPQHDRNAAFKHARTIYDQEKSDAEGHGPLTEMFTYEDGFGRPWRSLHALGAAPSLGIGEANESRRQRARNRTQAVGDRAYPAPGGRTKQAPTRRGVPCEGQQSPDMRSVMKHREKSFDDVVVDEAPSLRAGVPQEPVVRELLPHDMCRQAPPYGERFKDKFYVESGNHDQYGHEKFSHDTCRRTYEHLSKVTHTTQPRKRDLAYGNNTWNSSLKFR